MGNSQPSPGSAENPWQEEPKEEHTETHSNQTDKIKDKDKKSSKGKMTNNIQGNSHKVASGFLNRNFTSQKGMAWYI